MFFWHYLFIEHQKYLSCRITSYNVCYTKLLRIGQPWSVSTPAQVAGVACLKEYDYIKETLKNTITERDFLSTQLSKLGFTVFESNANFILFKTDFKLDLYELLYKKGILIRKCNNFIGLDNKFYRIAVKNRSDNIRLIKSIADVLEEIKHG